MTDSESEKTENITLPDTKEYLRCSQLLLKCPSLGDKAKRKMVLDQLPTKIKGKISENDEPSVQLFSIVQTCAEYIGGLDKLVIALYRVEGKTKVWAELEQYLKPFTRSGQVLPEDISSLYQLSPGQLSSNPAGVGNTYNIYGASSSIINVASTVSSSSQQSGMSPIFSPSAPPFGHVGPLTGEFAGRDSELKSLGEKLKPGSIVNVHGMPGVGKSRLVLQAMRHYAERFPDGQLYLDLEESHYTESLKRALIALAPSENLVGFATDEDKLVRLLQLLKGFKDKLVVIDNADFKHDALERATNLLHTLASEATLLFTTRHKYSQNLLTSVDMGIKLQDFPLKPTSSLITSQAIFNAYYDGGPGEPNKEEKIYLNQIVQLCSGLPLALELAGCLAVVYRGSLKDLAKNMQDRLATLKKSNYTDQQRSVRASFELSYEQLDAKTQFFLSRLSLCPLDFDSRLATRALTESSRSGFLGGLFNKNKKRNLLERWYEIGSEESEPDSDLVGKTVDHLNELSNAALLTIAEERPQPVYSFHSLMRAFALDKLTEMEFKPKEGKAKDDPASLSPDQQRRKARFLTECAECYAQAGLYIEALTTYGQARRLYSALGNQDEAARIRLAQSYLYMRQNKYDEAQVSFREVVKLYQDLKNLTGKSEAQEQLVEAYARNQDFKRAISTNQELQQVYLHLGDLAAHFKTILRLVRLHLEAGAFALAKDVYEGLIQAEQYRQFCQQTTSAEVRVYEAATLEQLGDFRKKEAEDKQAEQANADLVHPLYEEALFYYKKAFELNLDQKNPLGLASSGVALSFCYDKLGDSDRAASYLARAHIPYRYNLFGWNAIHVSELIRLAQTFINKEYRYEDALTLLYEALNISQEKVGLRQQESFILYTIGYAWEKLYDHTKAFDYYRKALLICQEIGSRQGEAATLHSIGNVYYSLSQYQIALEYYQKSLPIRQEIGDRQGEAATLHSIGNVYDSLSQYQIALEYYQKSLP
ncbi:MAG: tetratricopeptide repeat protein, partial [Chloroflexota bacterium]